MSNNMAPVNLTYFLDWRQAGEWQYTCTLPASLQWPFRKEDGTCEWLWQMDSHLWIRTGGSDIHWEDEDYDAEPEGRPRDIFLFVNENNAAWRRLDSPPWRCAVDLGPAGTGPDIGGLVVADDGEKTPFTSYVEMERVLWRSMQNHFRLALDVDLPQDDLPSIGHDRGNDWDWRRSWIDADFRTRARLPARREEVTRAMPVRFTVYLGSDSHGYFTHEVQAYDTEGVDMQAALTAEISVRGAFFRDGRLFLPVPGEKGVTQTYEGISAWGVMAGAMDRWEKAGLYRVLWSEGIEHPYTHLLRHATGCGVWSGFEEATGAARQIPYTEIAKVLRHITPDSAGHVGRATAKKVRDYFQSQGYRTAKSAKVSVDELMEKLVINDS